MTALESLMSDHSRAARARFFLRAGRSKGLKCGDGVSGELFGLPLILEAEGLSSLARHPERDYLQRCRDLIRGVSLDLGAG